VIGADDVERLRAALLAGGIGLVPTDTVYGLAAAIDVPEGVDALYALKNRPRTQPCQVLIYSPEVLDAILIGFDPVVVDAVRALVPGTVTCVVPDAAHRFAVAAGATPGSVGLRVPAMSGPIATLELLLIATSANDPGGPDPATIAEVPRRIRDAADVVLDVGPLPGMASAVVDLRPITSTGRAVLLRQGPSVAAVQRALAAVGVALEV
jgi:L-threonylcarbamoyladenylate synthase